VDILPQMITLSESYIQVSVNDAPAQCPSAFVQVVQLKRCQVVINTQVTQRNVGTFEPGYTSAIAVVRVCHLCLKPEIAHWEFILSGWE